jgi:hypothetical protein
MPLFLPGHALSKNEGYFHINKEMLEGSVLNRIEENIPHNL